MDRDAWTTDYAYSPEGRNEEARALLRPGVYEPLHWRQQLAGDSRRDQESELRRLADRGDGSTLQIRAGPAVSRHGSRHRSSHRRNAMKVSRREFVSTAGYATAASLCAIPSFAFAASDPAARTVASCALLDLEANCALPESLAGMQAALGATHRRVTEIALKGEIGRAS